MPAESTVASAAIARTPPLEPAFPDAHRLRSRDVARLLVRAWPFIRPYRRHLIYLFIATIPGLAGGLVALNLTRVFFDVVGHGAALTSTQAWMLHVTVHASRRDVLIHACVVTALMAIVILPAFGLVLGYAIWILQRISNLFRVNLYTRLQELSVRFHSEEKIGDAIFRMFQDSAAIPQVINGLIVQPVIFVPAAIGSLVYLIMYDSRIALIAALLLPANWIVAWWHSAPLRGGFVGEREAAALVTTRIEETLSSIKAVKAFGTEESEAEVYARENWRAFVAARRARMRLVRYRVALNTVRGTAYSVALYVGAMEVMAGGTAGVARAAVSLGLFRGTLALFGSVSERTRRLANLWGSMQDVVVAISRVFEMLSRAPEQTVSSGRLIPPKSVSELSFEHVSFGYDAGTPVLSDVSFNARAGEITALAGASGSGKSTTISLIVRFFDPAAGGIRVDGREIREFDLAAWRGMLSVALQESPLFTATLRDNIAYGRPDATDAEVVAAASRAGLGHFMRDLPDGINTVLGEKGSKISTGQAQRIGLARALLRDAPILLLDEPTASLDGATEATVMLGVREWVNAAPQRRMAIVATHRRTTASYANRIYRIAAGRLDSVDDSALETDSSGEVRDV